MTAPHGYVFRKLSGREMDFFVRAGNMLRKPGCTAVFNHLILRKLPLNCSLIYIDSFTILSFAISLQSIVRVFSTVSGRPLPLLAIESTHSYEISPDFRIPNENNYLVLISASTSGGLARKLVDEFQADPTRIIHLLGVGRIRCPVSRIPAYISDRSQRCSISKPPGRQTTPRSRLALRSFSLHRARRGSVSDHNQARESECQQGTPGTIL